MTDLEVLKQRADNLGISYRADIKEKGLLAKINELQKPVEDEPEVITPEVTAPPEKDVAFNTYRNTTKNNMFTEDGRCPPNRLCQLTEEEAMQYKGLERV